MYNPFSLEGKTILVTGASSGIGRATAIECSKMGAKIVACGRNENRLAETMGLLEGVEHSSFVGDLTDDAKIAELVSTVSVLDGFFASAGQGVVLPLVFSNRKDFEKIFNVNFFSPVELLRQLMKKKKISRNGSVVFVSSIGGTRVYDTGNTIYGTTKSALSSLICFAATEFASKNIRVNGICPGRVITPLIQSDTTMSEEQIKADIALYPLKRYGQPEDVARAAVYLLSDASSWVTGQSLIIDGGRSIG